MHSPDLAMFPEFDVLPASLKPPPFEDENCDSNRELHQAKARPVPRTPRTQPLPDEELPRGTLSANYGAIAPPGFLLAGKRSRQLGRSKERCCGNERCRVSRTSTTSASGKRCPKPRAFAWPSWPYSEFHHRRFHCYAAYIPGLHGPRTAAARSRGEQLRPHPPRDGSGCAPEGLSCDLTLHSGLPPSSARACQTRQGVSRASLIVGTSKEAPWPNTKNTWPPAPNQYRLPWIPT